MLKISVSKAGQKKIEAAWDDVEHTWKKIEHSKSVRNVENSLKRWGDSKEMHDLEALDKKFLKSKRG